MVTMARSGHELPVYPSYYPHEIEITMVAPERAIGLLVDGQLHAFVGGEPHFSGAAPAGIGAVESLGTFVIVRVNPASPLARDQLSSCALSQAVVRGIGERGGLILHPYPVTPLHGDYLQHVDLAEATKALLLGDRAASVPGAAKFKVRAGGESRRFVPPEHLAEDQNWDAELAEIGIADLVAGSRAALNGWLGPWWIRTGWFQAYLLLAGTLGDDAEERRVGNDVRRLQDGDDTPLDRINLARELVQSLAAGCRTRVAGFTIKREYFNAEFSAGIENIGYDALDGLHSPIFLRTVKLKDFPWNGWLALGIADRPAAAWNPIAGLTDRFGRLMWFAAGDPAAIPSPYESAWMLNRITDVQASPASANEAR